MLKIEVIINTVTTDAMRKESGLLLHKGAGNSTPTDANLSWDCLCLQIKPQSKGSDIWHKHKVNRFLRQQLKIKLPESLAPGCGIECWLINGQSLSPTYHESNASKDDTSTISVA